MDGEALMYESSVTWEIFPHNIELLIDDSIFINTQTFTHQIDPAKEGQRAFDELIDLLWSKYDVDKSGALDFQETKKLLMEIAENSPPPFNTFDEK